MPQKRNLSAFQSDIAQISYSHLIELMIALRSYREVLVLVGGWVPYLLLSKFQRPGTDFQHIGSQDIDIAVNPKLVDKNQYATIIELIEKRGYQPKEDSTFSFFKKVITTDNQENFIQIDFLGPEYGGTPQSKRHQRVQDDLLLRKARGIDVVFDHCLDFELSGRLLNTTQAKAIIKVADIVGIIALKGIVLGVRYKEKDAYDIYSLVAFYKNGPLAVAQEIRPYLKHPLIQEGIGAIKDKFRSRDAEGPSWVADFLGEQGEFREQIITQAYMQLKRFLDALEK